MTDRNVRALFGVMASIKGVTTTPSAVFIMEMTSLTTGKKEPVLCLGVEAEMGTMVYPLATMHPDQKMYVDPTADEIISAINSTTAGVDELLASDEVKAISIDRVTALPGTPTLQ